MSNNKKIGSIISNSSTRLEAAIHNIDECMLRVTELRMIRDRVVNGTLKGDLYDFVNHDASLESLFKDMPKLDANASMEAIEEYKTVQLYHIDTAIEGVMDSIKKFLIALWKSFCEWVEDWTDANRRMKFRLQRHLRRMTNRPLDYGTQESFAVAKGYCYTYTQWQSMKAAAKALSKLTQSVPANKPAAWLNSNHKTLVEKFAVFGWKVTDTTARYDQPNYIRQERKIGTGAAGWSFSGLTTAVTESIDDINEERNARQSFYAVRRAFDKAISGQATLEDKNAMVKLVKIVKGGKDCTNIVVRAVVEIANIALRSNRPSF